MTIWSLNVTFIQMLMHSGSVWAELFFLSVSDSNKQQLLSGPVIELFPQQMSFLNVKSRNVSVAQPCFDWGHEHADLIPLPPLRSNTVSSAEQVLRLRRSDSVWIGFSTMNSYCSKVTLRDQPSDPKGPILWTDSLTVIFYSKASVVFEGWTYREKPSRTQQQRKNNWWFKYDQKFSCETNVSGVARKPNVLAWRK